jgi:hypothetical protein
LKIVLPATLVIIFVLPYLGELIDAGKSVLPRFACVTLAALLGGHVPLAHTTPEPGATPRSMP